MKTTPYELVFGQPPRDSAFPGLSNRQSVMEEDVQDLLEERERDEDFVLDGSDFDDHVHSGDTHADQWEEPEQENNEDQHTLIEEFAEDDNARDENSESKYEYSDGRQVDQREEPEQENSEDQHTIEEFAEHDNKRDENSELKFEYSDGRQVDQREEPEQENSENQYKIEELAEDDNEEWEIKPDSNTRPQLATTHKHIHIREEADKLYLRNAERMRMKYTKCKRKKVLTFSQGNVVSVRIPRIDRTSTDFHRIPCVVVERRGSKFFLYRLRYVNVSFCCILYLLHTYHTDVLTVY